MVDAEPVDEFEADEVIPRLRAPPGPNLVGKILAERYQILKCLAEGGMGTVYLAEHITIGRRLAVKVLSPDVGQSPEVVQRFLQEARAASMIQHEHIVDIIDFGYTTQGQAFLAMELLEGEDLATTLEREKRLPWPRLRRMTLQICRALNAAHEKGIIHRDMKPDNCFRIKRGGNADFIKLLDFGIAKVMTEASTVRGKRPMAAATAAGTLLGTPEYMAPELARDGTPDGRVDIYALGVMMYELLTGVVPFRGETFMATVAKHLTEEPVPPRERCPEAEIPPSIEAVILKAMAKDPEQRFQNIRELTEAIVGADQRLRSTGLLLPAVSDGLPEERASGVTPPPEPAPAAPPSVVQTTGAHRVQNTGAQPVLSGIQPPAAPPPPATPTPPPTALDLAEDHATLEEARPNPYRWLSAVLVLVVAGLGVAMWQLLQRDGNQPVATTAGDTAAPEPTKDPTPPDAKAEALAKTTAAPEAPTTGGEEIVTDPRFGSLQAITDEERQQISRDLQEHVKKCAKSYGIRREDIGKAAHRVGLRVEAGTGKIEGDLPSTLYGTLLGQCIIEALKTVQFQPGRKYMRFEIDFSI